MWSCSHNCIVCRAILGYYQMWVYPYKSRYNFLVKLRDMYGLLCDFCIASFGSSSKFVIQHIYVSIRTIV